MPLFDSRTAGENYTAQERAALVTFQILEGAELTTAEIARSIGITIHGTWYLMQNISRVVPVYTDETGIWRRSE